MGVWDHRRIGHTADYEIRCDGQSRVLVSINSTCDHAGLLIRSFVEACARQYGGTVTPDSVPAVVVPARREPTRADYEASDQFEHDARAWWRDLNARQRHNWARVVRKMPDLADRPVHRAAFSLHGGPKFHAAMARWAEGQAA